ncbi:gliding motility-associated C-terminal domain-containing protein [Nonlabens ulvanivorans]|uniref:T9SS type B sorting domain-containing protein n=2 Tax=Nonlabens ulvanivorans TaxID=906888 RepID=UPI0032640569
MKKAILLLLTLVISFSVTAQEESSWWIFGDGAGVEFNPNPQNRSSDPAVLTSGYDTDEGVASISDEMGNLLFFTDGSTVWNRNGVAMPNGTGLDGNFSSTQSAIVIKAPETAGVYFVATVGAGNTSPLSYSRIEMALNGGLGDVVPGVKNVTLLAACAEKVAATIQTGTNNAYIMTFGRSNATSVSTGSGDNNALFAWEVRGIAGPNVSFVLPAPIAQSANGGLPYFSTPLAATNGDRGMLRVSPDGTKLAIGTQNLTNQGLFLYDFNPGNGQFSGAGLQLDNGPVYGVEFSASSQYLYHDLSDNYSPTTGSNKRLVQYDLCDQANIVASRNEFANVPESRGTLQLGRDGEIYVARFDQTFLGRIENSETATPTYNTTAVDISPGVGKQGLPVFVQSSFASSFTVNDQCQGDATEFILACLPQVAASNWDFGDGNTRMVTGPGIVTNTYATAGTFTVTVNVTNVSGDVRDFTQDITIYENGIVDPVDVTLLDYCDDDNSGDEIVDLSQFTSDVLGTQDAATFNISYYANSVDADAGQNPLPLNYNATLGSNTIWVRIENNTSPINDGCSAIGSFVLTVSSVPTVSNIPDYEICDDASQDGIEDFDLASFLPTIATQAGDPVDVDYTIHESQADADMNMGAIDTTVPYTNTTSPQVLYVRLQNINDIDCFGTAPFNLVVLGAPTLGTVANIEVCDDAPLDGSSDFTLSDQDATVANGSAGTVTYHSTQADADSGAAALPNVYTVSGSETIYARFVNDAGCAGTTSFDITVQAAPAIGNAPDLTNICDATVDLNQNLFELSVQDAAVLNGLNPADYTISYYTTDSDAQNATNELPLSYTVPFQSGVTTDLLFARLENNTTGCFNTSQFTIIFERCEIVFPEGFSPNNDGINDTFSIPGLAEQYNNFNLQIFNRNGSVVYETSASNYEEFAGIPNKGALAGDGLLPVGTYFYVIQYNDQDEEDTASWVYINY